jgi:glutamate synthase (NADPH/NADH) small chain
MGQIGGFLKHGRSEHALHDARERVGDWDDIALLHDEGAQREQAGRCMACGVAFCQAGVAFGGTRHATGCPLHNLIPEWNDLLYRGLWREAYERLSMTNPFPEFTGRVCPALCEKACNLGLHDAPTCVRDDELAIVEHAFAAGYVAAPVPRAASGRTVAVVGSGPAGLAAAWQLTKAGHAVTVFERAERAGGLLMYGIPAMKLPKDVVARRVALLEEAGCRFELNHAADSTIAGAYDAVVVAVGATKPRALDVPGAQADGVVYALDYLGAATRALLAGDPAATPISAAGKRVVVVGGGDTGTDCLATALRQGAAHVTQLQYHPAPPARRDEAANPWPCWPDTLPCDYGHQEARACQGADPRLWSTDTLEALADEAGHVRALRVAEVEWSSGRPVPVAGTERELPCELVLVARGFAGPEEAAFGALGIAMSGGARRLPVCAGSAGAGAFQVAGRDGFFVAGDARRGQSLVVNAIDDGLRCAEAVDAWLREGR